LPERLIVRELSLFTGAGGGILGSKLLGWTTIGYVEWNDYCQRVLRQRIEDGLIDNAPIFGDIRSFNSEGYAERYRGMVDVISAGFPCQPFSVAGKRLAENDERNMWPETRECIRIVRPRFALLENVPGLISSGYFGTVLGELSEIGYDAKWCVLSAADVGAPHKRERLWILAYSSEQRLSKRSGKESKSEGIPEQSQRLCKNVPNPNSPQRERGGLSSRIHQENTNISKCCWWSIEPELGRVANGVARRVDRLKAIGNGQVPAVVRAAWQILSEGLIW
jgi:DNA (cytosine-5)-methyltransferase 1